MMQRGGGVQEIVVWYVHVIHIHNAAHSQPGDARFWACVIKLFCQGNYSNYPSYSVRAIILSGQLFIIMLVGSQVPMMQFGRLVQKSFLSGQLIKYLHS